MVKVLLLQQWYNLSAPPLEEALSDRLSFRPFVGLSLQDATPDHSTIRRFRTDRGEARSAQLFRELGHQLQARGMIVKHGTLLDATLVAAQVRRPSLAEGRGAKSPRDPDADWTYTQRGRQSYFGYKVHLGVEVQSGLIRQAVFTAAKVYESEVADRLVSGDERAVYADRAYESQRRHHWLKARGIKDRVMHRAHKHQREVPHWQQRRNALIDPVCKTVEKVFGTLKRSYGYRRVRYGGGAERGGDVVEDHGLQPETRGPDGGEVELKIGCGGDEKQAAPLGQPQGAGPPRSLGGATKGLTSENHGPRCASPQYGDIMQRSPKAGMTERRRAETCPLWPPRCGGGTEVWAAVACGTGITLRPQ